MPANGPNGKPASRVALYYLHVREECQPCFHLSRNRYVHSYDGLAHVGCGQMRSTAAAESAELKDALRLQLFDEVVKEVVIRVALVATPHAGIVDGEAV